MREYKGYQIDECEMANWREHGGRWIVISRHEKTGLPWADQHCPHYQTLKAAKESIDEELAYRETVKD